MLLQNWYDFLYERLSKHKNESIIYEKKSKKLKFIINIFCVLTLSISILGLGIDLTKNNKNLLNIVIIIMIVLFNLILVILNSLKNSYQFNILSLKHRHSYVFMLDLLTDLQLIINKSYPNNEKEYLINLKNKINTLLRYSPLLKDEVNGHLLKFKNENNELELV